MTRIALTDLHQNPFRDLKRLPAKPEKVAILKESIRETSFWDNLVCRKSPNGKGGFEIAYGHNRLEALRQLKWGEVDIPVRDLDNATMAKIMARENHEEWGAYAEVDTETCRAVIQAFGDGHLELSKPPKTSSKARLAPGFTSIIVSDEARSDAKVYTAQTLAEFLGWGVEKTASILRVLEFQTEPLAKGVNFVGLTSTQADKVQRETRRVLRETENESAAISIGKQLAKEFRSANDKAVSKTDKHNRPISTNTVEARANELMREARVKRHIAERQKKKDAFSLQAQDRQVATFLTACKTWEAAMDAATIAISKFSPEAKAFAVRRLVAVGKAEVLLKGRLK
jgi:DNA-binding HxlR family transcriptional regulator